MFGIQVFDREFSADRLDPGGGKRRSNDQLDRPRLRGRLPGASMNGLFFQSDVPGFRVDPEDEVPRFRVPPQVVPPGFSLDENGIPRQERSWSNGMQPGATAQLPDLSQTLAAQALSLPLPNSGDPIRPAPPRFPDWLYKLATMPLPRVSTVFDPRTGRRIVPYEPLINTVGSYPTTTPDAPPTVGRRASIPGISPTLRLGSAEAPDGAESPQRSWPHASAARTQIQHPWRAELAQPPEAALPLPSVAAVAPSGFVVANATEDGEQLRQRSLPQDDQARPKITAVPLRSETTYSQPAAGALNRPSVRMLQLGRQPYQSSSPFIEVDQQAQEAANARRTRDQQSQQRSRNESENLPYPAGSGGSSLGQNLLQSGVETIVPGAHYQQLARERFKAGDYFGAATYQAAALLDAALGLATLGTGTGVAAAGKTALAAGATLFRRGFDSLSQLQRYLGPAPKGMQWHHIVEQSQAAQFGQRAVQSVDNVVAIPIKEHERISGFYSSKTEFSSPNRVRVWLRAQSFEEQYEFGMERLRRVLGY